MNNSLARLLLCTTFASVATACVEPALDKEVAPFTVGTPGKADGSGMLSPEEMARLEAAFDAAIASGQETIDKLEAEIATLEAGNAEKEAQVAALVQSISAREAELQATYNNNLFFCLFFPNPGVCAIANVLANDSTLQQYRSQLAAAQEEQRRIQAEMAAYRAKRDDLRARIEATRAGKTSLIAMLHDDRAPSVPTPLADSPATGRAFWKARTMTEIEVEISKEISLLVELRNAAVELSQTLDESINTLRALEQSVDALVQEARGQFMDLLKGFLSGDPEAVAQQWLDDVLAHRTGELLATLEFPFSEFARHLVESDGTAEDDNDLFSQIVKKLLDDASAPSALTYIAATPVNVLDNTIASSPMNIAEHRNLSLVEVYVDIEHTYVGDLYVTLEHGGHTFVLSDRRGLSDDSINRTFVVPAAAGLPLDGQWTLNVQDMVAGDTGTLREWQLIAR